MVNGTAWSGAAETIKYGVHLGMWTNWSHGRVMGSTLTLSREDGNYLLSFTAFFIGLLSTRFWRIICFALHNSSSTSSPRDALYHQQQAILRNSDSANSGLLVFLQLAWAWRKNTKRAFVRVLPVIATAAFFAVAFTIAGGFSSTISTGVGNDVLLDGSECAIVNNQIFDAGTQTVLQPDVSRRSHSAANYAQQCYSTNTSGIFGCGTFVKPRIPSSVDNQTACPFAEGMCQSGQNLRLDTGYIDSHVLLGLNAPLEERVIFRTVLQCSPLVTEGYTSNISTSDGNFTSYNYGPTAYDANYTYRTSSLDSQYRTQTSRGVLKLAAFSSWYINGSTHPQSVYRPPPGLFPTDGDPMIAFLVGNGVRYLESTDDPWYRGNVLGEIINWTITGTSSQSYRPEQAASPMACLQQYQICNPALPENSRCGPLASWLDAQNQAAHLFNITYDQMANATYESIARNEIPQSPAAARYVWFWTLLALAVPTLTGVVNVLGTVSLASQQSLDRATGIMGTIPSNQWQLDVKNWWAIWMASLQVGMVNVAYGPHDPALEPFEILPPNSHIQKLCSNQKILSSDYTSFSVFGLCFIYVIGALIVAISYLLEYIQAWLYRHRNLKEYAYLEWTTNETLQLQRMAYQGLESGHWSRYTDNIPLTEPGNILADLPRSYNLDKKKEPDVEQGNPAEKPTATTVTTVQTAPLTQVGTESSTMTTSDDDSHVDHAGVAGRQPVEGVSPGHGARDDSVHTPVLPRMDSNSRPHVDAAPLEVEQRIQQHSADLVTTKREGDHGTAHL